MTGVFAIKVLLLFAGSISLIWSLRIMLSNRYFAHWQNTHWKEPSNGQWTSDSVRFNRYGRTLRTIGICLVMIFIVLFQ